MRRTLWCVVLALGLAVGYWWSRTAEPVGVIEDQLTAIDEGQYPRTSAYLSTTAQAMVTREEFVTAIQTNSAVMETRRISFRSRTRTGSTATITGVLTGYGHCTSEATYQLVKEDSQWRIQHFHWSAPTCTSSDSASSRRERKKSLQNRTARQTLTS